jgi:hypothetical protein
MIDPTLLRGKGWSEELIEAAQKVASRIDGEIQSAGQTEVVLTEVQVVEDTTTINFSAESTPISVWPRF